MTHYAKFKKMCRKITALQVTIVYLVTSTLWIYGSNWLMENCGLQSIGPLKDVRDGVFILVSGAILYLVASRFLITFLYSEKQLHQSQNRFRALYENMTQGVIYIAADGHVISANPAAEEITGMPLEQLINMSVRSLKGKLVDENGAEFPWRDYPGVIALSRGEVVKNIIMGFHHPRRKTQCWVRVDAVPQFFSSKSQPDEVFISIEDITEFQLAQKKIEQLAYYDALTGLPNRRLFMDRLSQTVKHAERNNEHLALLFIDLDKFKTVNDRFGHSGGDDYLCEVAARLENTVRKSDTVARLSGDEFVVLLSAVNNGNDGELMAKKLFEQLQPTVDIHGHDVSINASIGIASYPQDAASAEGLLQCADTAMYRAKNQGKNNFCSFNQAINNG
nr:sensor domain-containing diguanylate cyclase [uncultured Desulfuromonas sp.]